MKEKEGCRVCGNGDLALLYESPSASSFTSAQVAVPIKLRVAFCELCGHAQTPPLENIAAYYDISYNYRNRNVDEDDIYGVDGDQITFRSEHQAAVVENKYDLSSPIRVLDFGCGKAASLRKLVERHPNIIPYAFDVSEAYSEYWAQFIAPEHQAPYEIPESWHRQLDLILSFFALEHVEDPRGMIDLLRRLLKPNGRIHLVVPHLYRNASDMLVADHINHFSRASIERLFRDAGFASIEVDAESHMAALIVTATLSDVGNAISAAIDIEVAEVGRRARAIAEEWTSSAIKIREFAKQASKRKAAIYGSGIYGQFIATTLSSLDHVAYFIDANPFRQGLHIMKRPVVAPDAIEDDVEVVLVGLNPRDARRIIDGTSALHAVQREFIYL